MPISNYIIASHRLRYKYSNDNGFLIVHARVPIPRKGSNRLIAFREKMQYDVFLFTTTCGNTPTTPFPDHPPLMVKDTLFVVKVERTISGFGKVLNKKVIARK